MTSRGTAAGASARETVGCTGSFKHYGAAGNKAGAVSDWAEGAVSGWWTFAVRSVNGHSSDADSSAVFVFR